ncbi:MAG: GNAT family N-acetyltransferase [Saprospiraceae bacterium]|nr:GNAT family N-acetyltransferase [Saprospiraceae bacterium]|tara:strand:- start:2236 stop:2766 length:531 start_codon:yes stop_codon:yes gene_type:complete
MEYLFLSERLGFRKWKDSDLDPFIKMNADPEVMKYFLSPLSSIKTLELLSRIKGHFKDYGYCLYAVDRLDQSSFIGFIGIMPDTMGINVSPCIEIGWRLDRKAWNKGFATEGARRCIEYAFKELNISEIYSCTAMMNTNSERVMQKAGMSFVKKFNHPRVPDGHILNEHVLYRIKQ